MSRSAASSLEKLDMKVLPLLLITASGSLWCLQTCSRKRCATHGDCRHGMDGFRQPVHYYKDGVVPFGLQQLSDSVNGDDLPTVAWDLVGHKLPHLLCQEGFAVVAGVTPCNVAGDIAGDAQPPVIAGDQLGHLPPPWVASYHGVMVHTDDIMAELGVLWDIHTSPIQDQVSVLFPLIRSKGACSKFSECLDYCIIVVRTSLDVLYQLIASAVH